MQIYTRVGDKGYTNIIGGGKIAKDSSRVRAYGELDELNSNVGFAISCIDNEKVKKELLEIQKFIFDCGTDLADPQMKEKKIGKQTIEWLEERIDFYSDIPDEVESFILPGGSPGGGMLHICRTVARRAERTIVEFQWTNDMFEDNLKFINRLSDYFYALARVINKENNISDTLYDRGGKVFHTNITKKDIIKS